MKGLSLGRGSRIRTCGPLLPKQVLYQAELCPDTLIFKHLERLRPTASLSLVSPIASAAAFYHAGCARESGSCEGLLAEGGREACVGITAIAFPCT